MGTMSHTCDEDTDDNTLGFELKQRRQSPKDAMRTRSVTACACDDCACVSDVNILTLMRSVRELEVCLGGRKGVTRSSDYCNS